MSTPGSEAHADIAKAADAERIAQDRPFGGSLEIDSLARASGWKVGGRGSYFVATGDGRSFKLRICPSPRRARKLASLFSRVPRLLPRLEARDGCYLLIERLVDHHKLDPTTLRAHSRPLGRMYAEAHASAATPRAVARFRRTGASRLAHRKFSRELALLQRSQTLEEDLHRRIAERVRAGVRRHGLPVTLEIRDFHMGNLMADAKGELRFVDEEGIGFFLKGLGYAKLLAHVPEAEPHREFREGYAELADPAFLSGEYARLVRLIDGVHSVASKLRRDAPEAALARSLEVLRRAAEA